MKMAGLPRGILPIIADGLEAYQLASTKILTFKNAPGVARTAQAVLLVQRQSFVAECRYLLRLVVPDYHDATAMTVDVNNRLWRDRGLDMKLTNRLGAMYEGCDAVLGIIGALLREILEDVQWLQDLGLQSNNSGMIFHEIRRSWNVAFNKTKIKKKLDALRDRNMDLAGLRTQLSALIQDPNSRPWPSYSSGSRPKHVPREFSATREEAQDLYHVLASTICQPRSMYNAHWAKIYVNAQVETSKAPNDVLYDALCFDLAVYHQSDGVAHDRTNIDQLMMWLYVRCKSVQHSPSNDRIESPTQGSPDTEQESNANRSTRSAKRGRVGLEDLRENFAKRVRFFEPETPSSASTNYSANFENAAPHAEIAQSPSVSVREWKNIRDYGSVCHFLEQNREAIDVGHCMGFLDSQGGARHTFYSGAMRPTAPLRQHQVGHREVVTLRDLIVESSEKSFPIVEQLRVAAEVTRTMLKFVATSWLKDDWNLHDFSLFGTKHSPLGHEDTLKTMHLTALFSDPSPETLMRQREMESLYRIRDWSLASLGSALLELGYRQSLEEYRSRIEPHTILTARRLVESCPTPLGPRFQRIVKQCFEYGSFESVTAMQATVYADVLRGLESMIHALSI